MRDGLLGQRVPLALTREGRLQLLAEAAQSLLAGRQPSAEARLFLASALTAWLRTDGPLERHLRVGAPRGSHKTAPALARELGLLGKEKKKR